MTFLGCHSLTCSVLQADIEGKGLNELMEFHCSFSGQIGKLIENASKGIAGSRVSYYRINGNARPANTTTTGKSRGKQDDHDKYNICYWRVCLFVHWSSCYRRWRFLVCRPFHWRRTRRRRQPIYYSYWRVSTNLSRKKMKRNACRVIRITWGR